MAWCGYDFANSSFSTIIVTVVFSVYFTKIICADAGPGRADFLWGLAGTLSQSVALVLSPFLGAWADFRASKKRLLAISTAICCAGTLGLAVVGHGDILTAFFLFIVANIAFSLGENFNAGFLPELAKPEETGRISGYGWAFGYVGGLASLFVCLPLLKGGFTVENVPDLRLSILFTALFFALCALPALLILRDRSIPRILPARDIFRASFASVWETTKEIARRPLLRTFFSAFFLYTCGVTTVISWAAIYAEREIGFTGQNLIMLFLVLQISGSVGAFAFGFVQDKWGSLLTLRLTLVLWIGVIVAAYYCHSVNGFYLIGNLAGLGIGSLQSAGRAVVAYLAPPDRRAEYFGFWGLFSKLSAAVGPFVYGTVSAISGSQRIALLGTLVFFISGFILLGAPSLRHIHPRPEKA
ncbi:MFS transporter, UMF1 family [Verrucomicrobium sp. GAS474]|nr:MFS transporter, UMF1 family [Verrucomicrobium sp. GAS474]